MIGKDCTLKTCFTRGRDLRPANITSKLQCFYSKGSHPMYTIGPLRVEVSKRLKKRLKSTKKTFQFGLLFPPGDLAPSVHHGDPRPSPPRRTGQDHRQSSSTVEKVQPSIWFLDHSPSMSTLPGQRWLAKWSMGQA